MGIHFIEHLSPWAAEKCLYFERLHAQRHDDIALTLHAIVDGDAGAFMDGLDQIHPSEHARMTRLILLSKIAYLIRKYKDVEPGDHANGPCSQAMADRFTTEELERLCNRFVPLDNKLQADTEQYESLFQSSPMKYLFYDMPENFDVNDFIANWSDEN